MRLSIDKNQFLKALINADKAIPSKSAMPILNNFKLELTERGLEVTGSNFDLTIRSTVPYMVDGKQTILDHTMGAALINAHLLTEVIRKMDGDIVSLDIIDNSTAKIDDGKSSFSLKCFRAEEYPDIDLDPNGATFDIPCSVLSEMVDQTAFAAATRDTRPVLIALNLNAHDGVLVATATDSSRLSQKTVSIEDQDVRFRCNIPARSLADVVRMFDNADMVRISISEQKALFQFDYNVISTRLTPGDYPVSPAIIPTRFNYYLEVSAQELLAAIGRISLLSNERDAPIKLSMNEEEVEISVKNEFSGSAHETISTFQFSGNRHEVSFNPMFVIDAIKALKSEDVTFCFQGDLKAFVVKNPKDDSVVELVSQMHAC